MPLDLPPDPTALLRRLPSGRGRFLLESGGGPPEIARYSFLGHRPFLEFWARGRQYSLCTGGRCRRGKGDPFSLLDELLQRYQLAGGPDLPAFPALPAAHGLPPFFGGAVGYFGYDLGRLLEPVPSQTRDDLQLPDLYLGFYDAVVVVDHQTGRVELWACPVAGESNQTQARARELRERLEAPELPERLEPSEPPELPGLQGASPALAAPSRGTAGISSNFTRAEYLAAVQRAIDYIYAGDIFQVNLAQRFSAPLPCSPDELWARLRRINPAPFSAFLDVGSFQVISASPERFLAVAPAEAAPPAETAPPAEGLLRRVETRPIKGTRPRGATPAQDEELRAELAASEKDRAELNMIVDLERNDLGRVCRFGSVRVPDRRRIETYPTVFHTVATVEGLLRPEVTVGQLLRATFPGGSITGAPKVRAMQIIEELETVRRGIYTGSVGYIGCHGVLDLNIVIRTFVVKDRRVYFHAGGGIVADSQPESEYEETLAKARALMQSLGMAVAGIPEGEGQR